MSAGSLRRSRVVVFALQHVRPLRRTHSYLLQSPASVSQNGNASRRLYTTIIKDGNSRSHKQWRRWGAGVGVVGILSIGVVGFAQGDGNKGKRRESILKKSQAVSDANGDDESGEGISHQIGFYLNAYFLEPILTMRRFLHLVFIFLPVIVTSPILLLEWTGSSGRKRERMTTRWWYRVLATSMERAGPTFIKLAQWAGSRTDLFPAELCARFGKLHSNGKPHSLAHTKRVLERAFQRPFEEIFSEWSDEPLGIGAVAQVYKATLNPHLLPERYLDPKRSRKTWKFWSSDDDVLAVPSTAVAIKILHPKVERILNRDLKIMSIFAYTLNLLPGAEWLSLPEEVEVFGGLMRSQLDLTVEAGNLLRFEDNFMFRREVSFPRPLIDYTKRTVLVEEFEDAVPLKAFLREGGGPFDDQLANIGLDAFLHMLLIDNFAHSDLHPGNIMVKFYKPTSRTYFRFLFAKLFKLREDDLSEQDAEASTSIAHRLRSVSHDREKWMACLEELDREGWQPELVFIDTGLVTELNQENRKNFLDLFGAITQFDGYKAGKLMVERCRTPQLTIDQETFALKMQHLVLQVKSKSFTLSTIRIGDILSQVLQYVRQHHVKMEPDFVNTVISILLLEGIGRQLDPHMDLFKSSIPILRRLGGQMNANDLKSGVSSISTSQIGTLLRIWFWVEARQMINIAVSEVDQMLRYDVFMPNI